MIRSFKNSDSEKIFNREHSRAVPANLLEKAWVKLAMIHAAVRLEDLRVPPGNKLEKLSGDREGQFSIRINQKYRICFYWQDSNAFDVEVTDYH
ncbi:MAG: type II toxin-antitoxin system RelE/ParE family toxin [Bacteroidota bacterium]|jgi:proteic killer suppression protein|nr:type II toxin-antitoxin system RelE/ParE family toxin [Ignavibacteria bacterium]HEX2925270.1 type II toxin-antitoxin system RelE/ParE family toxin [Ruminiclostridium sp.]MCU7501041.1 type II toxin-antitoxin system RelE/ParE family toxin [Ignavibacteria bacterium]MCU7514028.1 type II toxin-antitoxin system RelE/ParE family toxin [Ignavibacteria bacterium]MCU7521199.1 type II toxin-antitoxin system RelE/ParE family toxin [Ignavibacteria bacterium]